MDLNDYFDPVALEKPDESFYPEEYYFSKNIRVHTPSEPVKNIEDNDLIILGIPEDRNSDNTGSAMAPDRIRFFLYMLNKIPNKLRIYDIGNLKPGARPNDTYYGLRDVLNYLLEEGNNVVLLGGTQDIDYGVCMTFTKKNKRLHYLSVDPRIDFSLESNVFGSETYLNKLLMDDEEIFQYTNLGHQVYYTDLEKIHFLQDKYYNTVRLGQLRENLIHSEPILRESHVISMDMTSIRMSDAPGSYRPSPNGLFGEEACQLSRYAGMSTANRVFGIYETNPRFDINGQTSHLAAQMVWYYMEGNSLTIPEHPEVNKKDFKEFIVGENNTEITFYKSIRTGRWWARIPGYSSSDYYMPCSHDDYLKASKNDIPDRWFRLFRKING
jgi:arginase family enzyme